MAEAESLRQIAHSRTPFSTWLGVILLFALFGIIVLAVIGPAPRGDTYEQTRAKKRAENLKTLRDEATKALTTYGWIDKNKGVAHIPISRAIELTVAELAQKKPAPAYPIATPAEAASPAQPAPAPAARPSAAPKAGATPKPVAVEGPKSQGGTQPAAAMNPPAASPGTQPGAPGVPAASPAAPAGSPAASASPMPSPSPSGSPLPAPEKTP